MENIQIDNTSPRLKLWQQYTDSEPVVNYFMWLRTYYQTNYFDFLLNSAIPALSIINAANDYLEYYAKNLFNIIRPLAVIIGSKWDIGQKWDSGNKWDTVSATGSITIPQFVKVLLWVFNWGQANWDIPTIYQMIADFCDIGFDEILIEQDSTTLDLFTITIPTGNDNCTFFWSMMTYYKDIMRVPYGVNFVIQFA